MVHPPDDASARAERALEIRGRVEAARRQAAADLAAEPVLRPRDAQRGNARAVLEDRHRHADEPLLELAVGERVAAVTHGVELTRQRVRVHDRAVRAIEDLIAERFGFDVAVLVRTGEEIAAVVAANPHADVATDGSKYHVAFLDGVPDADAIANLTARDFEPERLAARGREIYVWCPDGLADSAAIKALAKARLGVTTTVRNWNTVTKLLAMTD